MQRWNPIDSLVPLMFRLKETGWNLLLVSAIGSTLAVQTPGQSSIIRAAHPSLTIRSYEPMCRSYQYHEHQEFCAGQQGF